MELRYLQASMGAKLLGFVIGCQEEERRVRGRSDLKVLDARILSARNTDGPRPSSLIVTSGAIEDEHVAGMLCQAHITGVHVLDFDSFMHRLDRRVPASPRQMIRFLTTHGVQQTAGIRSYSRLKQVLEAPLALLLVFVLSPVILIAALLVKLTSPGPVIYSQARVGQSSRIFRIYKLRSMCIDAEANGAVWASALKGDQRLTRIGQFLRSSHIDELPQLWNVIRGDLSFIGPRPERPEFVQKLVEMFPLFALRTLVKPGITGWAQVKQGYANSAIDSLRKLELDLFYMTRHSPWLDAQILAETMRVLFTGGTEGLKRTQIHATSDGPSPSYAPQINALDELSRTTVAKAS